MSTPLPILNVTGFVVGQTGTFDLTTTAPSSNPAWINQNATVVFYNESAVGFRFSGRDTGVSFDLPAGAWDPVPIPVGEGALNYQVLYILSNPLVSQLIATYYAPNEQVPSLASLGNSPIGGTALTTATAVANDGNVSGTQFIESSVGGDTKISDTNDGIRRVEGNPPGYFYWGGTLAGGDKTAFRVFPADASRKDWQLHYGAGFDTLYIINQTDGVTPLSLSPGGQVNFGGTNAIIDSSGNFDAGNDTLRSGIQESGSFLVQSNWTASFTFSYWIRFRKQMTNIPSSITRSGETLTNVSTVNVSSITKDGFRLDITTTASGVFLYSGNWVTVGN